MKRKSRIITAGAIVLAAVLAVFLLYDRKGEATVLATVNGQAITLDRFLREVDTVEEPTRGMFKEDPAKYLDLMIMKMLVLQEARSQGFEKGKEEEDDMIREFLEKRFSTPPDVSEKEVESFFKAHKDRMGDMQLEQAAPMIEQLLSQGKQEEEYMSFLDELRSKANVEIDHDRLKAIAAKTTDGTNTKEEFYSALKSGRPILVDFGANSCIPCRQLRPILDEIRKEKAGKVEVLVIDVYKHQDLSREYKVQVIPTLVFFDANGNEVFRTQGFMPKAALLEHLAKIGVV
ncbi:MAG: thioredoxin domain-containing protein [Desulfatiglandales bacterium]